MQVVRHTPVVFYTLNGVVMFPNVNATEDVHFVRKEFARPICVNIWTRVTWKWIRVDQTWNLRSLNVESVQRIKENTSFYWT